MRDDGFLGLQNGDCKSLEVLLACFRKKAGIKHPFIIYLLKYYRMIDGRALVRSSQSTLKVSFQGEDIENDLFIFL